VQWELAVLAKELIVLAPDNAPTDLRSWKQFSTAVNKLKTLDNAISERYEKLFRENIFIEMSRHAHHQFWWQRTDRMSTEVTRYLKIFKYPAWMQFCASVLGSMHMLALLPMVPVSALKAGYSENFPTLGFKSGVSVTN
jgi:hypothetical protein